jgi:crotonobetainyl-CoA:carnitine CoA-transferase CaiB-like acyl-CoA transferase
MLSGMRVASFTHWLQGPATTQYLADMGAEVIRVEAPGGSYERHWRAAGRAAAGTGTLVLATGRNSRSVVIDLKAAEGRQAALRLIDSCDVVVENYRPGVMDRLGLGYAAIRARKPDIIYASATGYGPDGPLSKGPGQDLLVQARAGMVAQTGEWLARPTPIGNSGIDQHGAALLAMGIIGAYVKKLTAGRGTRVEGSLYNACADLMQEGLVHYFSCGHDRSVMARDPHLASWYLAAPYGAYRLKDAAVVVSINGFDKLAAALQSDELAALAGLDPWEHRDACARALAGVLAGMAFADVKARFDGHGIWYEKVQDFDDMRTDPQAAYAGIFLETAVGGEPVTLINHPNRYDGAPPPCKGLPLKAGEDTRAVLAEIGYDAAEIDALIACGAVAAADGDKAGED